jgi:hypothetical protein
MRHRIENYSRKECIDKTLIVIVAQEISWDATKDSMQFYIIIRDSQLTTSTCSIALIMIVMNAHTFL